MVQISKKKLPEEILSKLFRLFFEVVGNKDDKNEFSVIINDLFSKTEQIMIIKRLAIIYLLLKNIDQRTIADTIKVSPSTVCKFALIAQESKGIDPFFKDILTKDKIKKFFEDLFYSVYSPTRYGTDWKTGYKLEFERQKRRNRGI
jgi:Trp operon repressor